jgi:hypothetical protein
MYVFGQIERTWPSGNKLQCFPYELIMIMVLIQNSRWPSEPIIQLWLHAYEPQNSIVQNYFSRLKFMRAILDLRSTQKRGTFSKGQFKFPSKLYSRVNFIEMDFKTFSQKSTKLHPLVVAILNCWVWFIYSNHQMSIHFPIRLYPILN